MFGGYGVHWIVVVKDEKLCEGKSLALELFEGIELEIFTQVNLHKLIFTQVNEHKFFL
jgi:hypothetical protein